MDKRLRILNIWVDPLTRKEAIKRAAEILKYGQRPHTVFASNPEKNFSIPKDPELYKVFAKADLLLPDGIGMVWAARILYGAKIERVPGAEFMEEICKLAAQEGYKIFVYGATEEVNRAAVEILPQRYPGLMIGGRAHGYLGPEKMSDLIQQINESGAAILFLALGSPKQEKWYATYCNSLENIRLVQGVGGTLDTIAGKVPRAPEIWQKCGVEWLYRLLLEPKRLKRQKILPLFMVLILGSKIGLNSRGSDRK
jgi:N-acetylglucosaminyldiphosphoundecaprenol N-acetyl-beta-D-mannosaminyltransferase